MKAGAIFRAFRSRRELGILAILLCIPIISSEGREVHLPAYDEPMAFEVVGNGGNCNGCEWIMAQGRITSDTPIVFQNFIEKQQKLDPRFPYPAHNIVLHSPGGTLSAGLELGRRFRKLKLNTSIGSTSKATSHPFWDENPGTCASSCAYAFLGGISRAVNEGSRYGVHQFSFNRATATEKEIPPSNIGDGQAIAGLLAYYIHSMGADPSILFLAGSTKPDEVLFLTKAQLKDMRIETEDLDQLVFKGWTVEPYREGAVAVSTMANASGQKETFSLFCRRQNPPRTFLMISDRLYDDARADPISLSSLKQSIHGSKLLVGDKPLKESEKDTGIAELRIDNKGWVYVTAALSQAELNTILGSNTAEFALDLPHSLNFRLGAKTQIPPGVPYIRLALRNCI